MRNRLALPATLAALVLSLTIGQNVWAQQGTRRAPGRPGENQPAVQDQNRNANAGQDRNQSASETETIRGIVAGITSEGEVTFDYQSNRGVMAEAAFLTVVGAPMKSEMGNSGRRASATDRASANDRANENDRANANDHAKADDNERSGSVGRKRHNVYMVWLSPKTKICSAGAENDKSNQNQSQGGNRNQSQTEKKEVALDQLEVGDHVEIQFSRREESGANSVHHQTEQMRQKHGRHRTFVVNATAITILPSYKDEDRSGSKTEGSSNERPR